MATIFVEQLNLPASIGVWPEEHQRSQSISVDLELTVADAAVALAAGSEALADTLDYGRIAALAEQVVGRRHYPLVETLTHALARAALALPGVRRARVRVRKLHCLAQAQAAGVEVTLDAEGLDDRGVAADTTTVAAVPLTIGPTPLGPTPIVIVGGGVAGLSAALWCWRLGHPALLVDPSATLGGQLLLATDPLPDLPGTPPTPGPVLAQQLRRQFALHGGRWLRAGLQAVEGTPQATGSDDSLLLELASSAGRLTLSCSALIVATGVRRRALSVPGAGQLVDRGVLTTLPGDLTPQRDQNVVIVGGGDTACEAALALLSSGSHVTIVHRGAQLSARAPLRQALVGQPRLELVTGAEVARLHGDTSLEAIELRDGRRLAARWLLVAIGWQPNSEALPAEWLDPRGFVRCAADLRLLADPRAFAAGDIRQPAAASVAAAAGDGACAARGAVRRIEDQGLAPAPGLPGR